MRCGHSLGWAPALVLSAWSAAAVELASPVRAEDRFLDAPVFDDGATTTHRELTWDDFKGRPARQRFGSAVQLHKSLALGDYRVVTWREDEEWIAAPLDVRPYAVVNNYGSHAERPGRTDEVLAHHQRHFDLFEAWGRALAVPLRQLRGRGRYAYDAERALRVAVKRHFAASRDELFAFDDKYDRSTGHGLQPKAESRWAKKIQQMMDDATAALVKAIEQPPPDPARGASEFSKEQSHAPSGQLLPSSPYSDRVSDLGKARRR